jgi:hypothetical protein
VGISPNFEKIVGLFEGELTRMVGRLETRTREHDRCDVDESGAVSFFRGSSLLWKAHGEVIASLVHGGVHVSTGGLLRWTWADGATNTGRRIDAAYREAVHYGLDCITKNAHGLSDTEARRVVLLAAHLARADGVREVENPREVTFFALFDAGEGERLRSLMPGVPTTRPGSSIAPTRSTTNAPSSVTRPATLTVMPSSSVASSVDASASFGATVRSIPAPARPVESAPPARTPSLERVRAPSSAALAQCVAACPGFREAVLIVNLEVHGDKARLAVQLVALSSVGRLEVLETSKALIDAVGEMTAAARLTGELGWRRLVIRIAPKSSGTGYHLSVDAT